MDLLSNVTVEAELGPNGTDVREDTIAGQNESLGAVRTDRLVDLILNRPLLLD